MSTQATIDNLDFMNEHMCIGYKQIERSDTSHLSDEVMVGSEVPKLFDLQEILIEEIKHIDELKHVQKVVANTIGRLLGDHVEKVIHYFYFNTYEIGNLTVIITV